MSAARRRWSAKAAAIRSLKPEDLVLVLVASPGEGEDVEAASSCGRARGRRAAGPPTAARAIHRLRVAVGGGHRTPPSGRLDARAEQPRDRMRRLERRDDPLEAAEAAEG